MMTTAFKMLVPILSLPGVGLLFWHLTVNRRQFVTWLGGGSDPGFNANHLTYLFCFTAMGAAGAGAWFVSRRVAPKWRIAYLSGVAIMFWEFLGYFMDPNLWL